MKQPQERIEILLEVTASEADRDDATMDLAAYDAPEVEDALIHVYRAARYLAHHMPEVPAMILVCADHTLGSAPYTLGEPIVRELNTSRT